MSTRRLIVFLKSPATGRVKTRLAARAGKAAARELYFAMVADLLTNLSPLEDDTVFYIDDRKGAALLFDGVSRLLKQKLRVEFGRRRAGPDRPPDEHRSGAALRYGNHLMPIEAQQGAHLGQSMARSLNDAFQDGKESAILIGSDIPQIDRELIGVYFQRLAQFPMVLGPTDDGGYYLIGFRRDGFAEEVFEGIAWSGPRVYGQTLARAGELGLELHAGEMLSDIDTFDDLLRLLGDAKHRTRIPHVLSVARTRGLKADPTHHRSGG